jgi:hypothetical protein
MLRANAGMAIEQRNPSLRRSENMNQRRKFRPTVDGLEQRLTLNGSIGAAGVTAHGAVAALQIHNVTDAHKSTGSDHTHKSTGSDHTHKSTGSGHTHKSTSGKHAMVEVSSMAKHHHKSHHHKSHHHK